MAGPHGFRISMTTYFADDSLAERIRECAMELLVQRGPGRSICPSEVARLVGLRTHCRWQDLMRPVRTVAATLADGSVIDVIQHDAVVDIREVRGPIRLRLRSLQGDRNSYAA
jgi:hypothetical protein